MSLNLECDKIALAQTPTYVTRMCMMRPDGEMSWQFRGQNAKRAIHIYCNWRLSEAQDAFNKDNETYKDFFDGVQKEVAKIRKVLKKELVKVWVV
jgi:hypothetical protein